MLPSLDEDKRRGTEILIRKKKKKREKTGSIRCTQSEEERKKKRREVFPANINLKPLFDASLELLTRTPCCL